MRNQQLNTLLQDVERPKGLYIYHGRLLVGLRLCFNTKKSKYTVIETFSVLCFDMMRCFLSHSIMYEIKKKFLGSVVGGLCCLLHDHLLLFCF